MNVFFLKAQKLHQSAWVEFERKTYMQNIYANQEWMSDEMRKNLPQIKIDYFELFYNQNQSFYKPGKENDQKIPDWLTVQIQSLVYMNFDSLYIMEQKTVFEKKYEILDTLPSIEWKITSETRTIADYECRKAIGKICDSVVVIAFFCPQLNISSGPESFHGLPGLILGLAVPRLHMTWYAIQIKFPEINIKEIIPFQKKTKRIKFAEMFKELTEAFKEWGEYRSLMNWHITL